MFSSIWMPFCPDPWEPDFPWPIEPSFRAPVWDFREPPDFPLLTESSSLLAPGFSDGEGLFWMDFFSSFSFVWPSFCPGPWEPPDFSRPTGPSFSLPDWDLREPLDFPWLTASSSFLGFPMDRDSSDPAWPNLKIIT